MFGIESRTSNYPRKLHRLCIHMRKYLAGHRKNKWRKYRKKTRNITRVHLLINISHSNSSIDNFKYSRSINTCLKLISWNILFNQENSLFTVTNYLTKLRWFCIRTRVNSWPRRRRGLEGVTETLGKEGNEDSCKKGERKKGNCGKGCTLQRQRSISGFHFVLGVLRRLRVTRLTHLRPHTVHTFIRNGHACTVPWLAHHSTLLYLPFPSSSLFPPISILVPRPRQPCTTFSLYPAVSTCGPLEGSSEGMLDGAQAQLARYW